MYKNIGKALMEFQKLIPDIKKDADNPFYKSKYAPLENILPIIKEPLRQAGLAFTQIPVGLCKLKTILIHVESGEFIEGDYEMTPSRQDPQGQGATITYMRRYALVSMLGLNTEEDDDGNFASKVKNGIKTKPADPTVPIYQRTDDPLADDDLV